MPTINAFFLTQGSFDEPSHFDDIPKMDNPLQPVSSYGTQNKIVSYFMIVKHKKTKEEVGSLRGL